ncbi:acetyltransferase [Phaeocystidibacter luteus]|uniref:Acetyltransferase n=1 Tax=Phaeocystidibacter luteus TaxID=911197 RepID=A0A6N6RIW7_9FLAO|nr:acetyltransferase [Phaeocystidibacter luteus]KAB2814336.1 acetyltransferase [Phaeocystidibacter luteus]
MKDIAIFGAGGFGREVALLIDDINQKSDTFNFIGYFDDGVEKGTLVNGHPVLGGMAELNSHEGNVGLVLAIGDCKTKKIIHEKITNSNVSYPTLIHPSAILRGEFENKIGEGSIVCAGCIITVNTVIGNHVILNLSCTVGHDATIGDYSSFMPSTNISGEVNVGSGVFVGTGTKIINLVDIGDNTLIGAGSVVTKTIPSNCTAVGIPAKPIKFHEQN